MPDHKRIQRRDFIATASAAVAAPMFVPSHVLAAPGRPGANDRLNVAAIGIGGRGRGLLAWVLTFRDAGSVNVPAVCDIDSNRLDRAKSMVGKACEGYLDYRELLARNDIDAVVIGTPDHWHAVQTVHACETGKHVYVEKPASCTVAEGRAMVDAARKHNRVVQVGAQARSAIPAWQAATYIRNGMLGNVHTVTSWHGTNRSGGGGYAPEPTGFDWDMWLGPMRWRRYEKGYGHGMFRRILESGGGGIRDRGAHVMSIILWCMNADEQTPVCVETVATPPKAGILDCPSTMRVEYTFENPDWKYIWEEPGESHGPGGFGMVFHGDKDKLVVCRDGTEGSRNIEQVDKKAEHFKVPAGGVNVYRCDKYDHLRTEKNRYDYYNIAHFEDWFQAIHDDRKPCLDIELGHRVATMNNLGNLSYILGRALHWDGQAERFVGDDYANRHLDRPQRHPYHV